MNIIMTNYTKVIIGVAMFTIALNGVSYVINMKKADDVPFDIQEVNYQPHMKMEDAQSVLSIIATEGFDSAFRHYSTYKDIGDSHFHNLRRAYIEAADELYAYLNDKAGITHEPPFYLKR